MSAAAALDIIHGLTDERLGRQLTAAEREALGPFNPAMSTVRQISERCLVGPFGSTTSFQATVDSVSH